MNKYTHTQARRTNTLERRRATRRQAFLPLRLHLGTMGSSSLFQTAQYTTIAGFTPGLMGRGAKEIDIPISERKFFLVVDMLFFAQSFLSHSLLIALCTKFTHYYFLLFFNVFRFSLRSAKMGLIAADVVVFVVYRSSFYTLKRLAVTY